MFPQFTAFSGSYNNANKHLFYNNLEIEIYAMKRGTIVIELCFY
jgi:hypothetical protein